MLRGFSAKKNLVVVSRASVLFCRSRISLRVGLFVCLVFFCGTGCLGEPVSMAGRLKLASDKIAFVAMPAAAEKKCSEGWCVYTDGFRYFSVSYPETWRVREKIYGMTVAFTAPFTDSSDGFAPSLSVTSENAPSSTSTLEGYYRSSKQNLKVIFPDYLEQKNRSLTVSGEPGRELVYTVSREKLALRVMQIFTVKKGRFYVITATVAQNGGVDSEEEIRTIINSFRFAD